MRKLKIFWMNHWLSIVVIFVAVVLVIFTVVGLSTLESFYRNMTLATIPLQLLLTGLNALIFVFFYMTLFNRGFMATKKNKVNADDVKVKFKDVIGLESAKREAMEVVQLLKDRSLVRKIGGRIIKGLLFIGPPGCGKTLLAKAIATEAKIPFISSSGSEFVEIFVGMGASRVRKLFKKARQYAYAYGACLVFIDEIDALGRHRKLMVSGGGQETDSTLNQLLVEMDGLESRAENVVVIAATNASEDLLDTALLRPGRFDRKIYMARPNLKDRKELFEFYLKNIKHDKSIDIERLAKKTVSHSPADIANITQESALIAARKTKEFVEYVDISEAMDRIELGMATRIDVTPQEKEQTAYHEAGHTAILYFLHPSDDVFKASIVPRRNSLGMVSHHPKEELHTSNREKLIADIKVSLAGYAAEKIKYNTTTSGVVSDFQKAMQTAHAMVWMMGMGGNSLIGDFTKIPDTEISNELKERLNQESMLIIRECMDSVNEFLKSNWKVVEAFAQELLKKEELDYDEIDTIFKTATTAGANILNQAPIQDTPGN